ncbi:MAG TPA: sucrase ferredoxin [Ardenticatenaceae bacterium]|nr:sucrase ferredoxin [Ardenticatenaceae bacterium]
MSDTRREYTFCSRLSVTAEECRFGTASSILENWFLLEYPRPWAPDAVEDSILPIPVKEHLASHFQSIRRSRILLIKQRPHMTGPIRFFVALSTEAHPRLYEFQLSTYEELLDLDVLAALAGDQQYERYRREEPLFLVCTHGTHDMCCAKFGLPVYHELAARAGDAVWQCSHVGGDRFAANVLCFPHAIYYGHVEPHEAAAIAESYGDDRLYLEKYRGRSCYRFAVQAAEYFLRQETGIMALSAFRLLDTRRLEPDRYLVHFFELASGVTHAIHIAAVKSEFRNFLTCKRNVWSNVPQYRLIAHHMVSPEESGQATP